MRLDNESRKLLEESARDWLLEKSPVSDFRLRRDAGEHVSGEHLWKQMAELGWAGMLVPEGDGGSGLGLSEMALILEQVGRNLAPSPLLSTGVIAAGALLASEPNEFTSSQMKRLASGELRVALAVDESHHHRPSVTSCQARKDGEGWIVSGYKTRVADVDATDFLVSARDVESGRVDFFWVPAANVVVTRLNLIDSRDHGEVFLDEVRLKESAQLKSKVPDTSLVDHVLDLARIGLSAEMLGTAWAAFDMTVDYLKIREQFGQVIGAFQALQHRAASLYVELELCRSVLEAAVLAADNGSEELAAMAAKSKSLIGETLQRVTNEAIQLHGGIGMTDEHDAGLFLKRARVMDQLYGNSAFHRDSFAKLRGF